MNSSFMNVIARGVAEGGIRVARFEFPYMRARRQGCPRRAPDPDHGDGDGSGDRGVVIIDYSS